MDSSDFGASGSRDHLSSCRGFDTGEVEGAWKELALASRKLHSSERLDNESLSLLSPK